MYCIRVYEDDEITLSTGFKNKCHKMNIIFQTTGGNSSGLNEKYEIPNKSCDNMSRSILLNLIHLTKLFFPEFQLVIFYNTEVITGCTNIPLNSTSMRSHHTINTSKYWGKYFISSMDELQKLNFITVTIFLIYDVLNVPSTCTVPGSFLGDTLVTISQVILQSHVL